MEKQGHLITYNIGLGLSISLILINQLAAQAGTSSDKTKWLTSSLGEVTKTNTDQSTITLKALSAKEDNQAKPITFSYLDNPGHAVKMRPFKANRKLPSRQDLALALIEQKAKLAQEANARLNGQVSTFIVGADNNNQVLTPHWSNSQNNLSQANNRNYISRNYTRQSQAKSRQSSFSLVKEAEQHLLSTTMPQIGAPTIPPTNVFSDIDTASSMTPMTMPMLSQPIMSTPIVETYSSNPDSPSTFPSSPNSGFSNNQTTASGFGSAGPPPFPLNLVPEATLKQLIRSLAGGGMGSRAGNTPRAAFGSWHSNSNNGNNASYSNLSYGGFQSHLGPKYIPSSNIATYRICALPAVTGSPIRSRIRQQKTQNISSPKDTAARNKMLLESQVRIAVYPAYTIQSLRPWNFAQ